MSASQDRLVLEDGTTYHGASFGALAEVRGEVVFNTAMTGYVEALTDPSYRGQILVFTYPLQGNYGVPRGPYESRSIQVRGVIAARCATHPSHHRAERTLDQWLKDEGVPGLCSVDTRTLTRRLRERGTILGTITGAGQESAAWLRGCEPSTMLDAVPEAEIVTYAGGSTKVLLIDTGAKDSIARSLLARGATVVRAPWHSPWEDVLPEADGVLVANGPGNPVVAQSLIARLRPLLERDVPVLGICLGHQLLALAAGASTRKLTYGHRSVNQPVRDLRTGRCFLTSQNHGYVVEAESLGAEWLPWFVNLNDGTNEGIRHRDRPIGSVQFHPEASPGPKDTAFVFDEFLRSVRARRPATAAHGA